MNDQKVGEGLAAAALARASAKNLLGYERIYHGTPSIKAAKSIKEKGLLKSKAGTASASVDIKQGRVSEKDIKGRVFTTTSKLYSKNYANSPQGFTTGEVIKGRVPYRGKGRLKTDHVISSIAKGTDSVHKGLLNRVQAAYQNHKVRVYGHSIPPRFLDHGKGGLGNVKQFTSKGNIRRYLSTKGGRLRFGKGVAQLGGAVALASHAMRGKNDS